MTASSTNAVCFEGNIISFNKTKVQHLISENGSTLVFGRWQSYPFDRRDVFRMERSNESALWKLFTKKGNFIATCNSCQKDFSYHSSSSNLRKHWARKHGGCLSMSNDDVSMSVSERNSSDSDVEQENAVAQIVEKKPKATWNYFTVNDSDNFEATCKICDKTMSYEFVSELTEHIREHGESPKDSDDEDFVPEGQRMLKRKYKSPVWNYFKATDDKMAVCLLCKKLFSYVSTISNLRKHLQRIHKDVNIKEGPFAKRIYLNGELYEIANEQDQDDDDDNVETIEMDPIYLDSDSLDKPPTPSPKKKQPKILPKSFSKILEEPVHSTKNTCSEILEQPREKIPLTPNTMASIDYFGQYVVSLLKELPKPVSDQLQGEIIKQIFASKMALDSQTVAARYEIKLCQNDKDVINVPEPVSYTIVQTNEAAEKVNDVTESVVKEQLE